MNQQPLLVDDVTMYLNKSIAHHTVVLSLQLQGPTPAGRGSASEKRGEREREGEGEIGRGDARTQNIWNSKTKGRATQ